MWVTGFLGRHKTISMDECGNENQAGNYSPNSQFNLPVSTIAVTNVLGSDERWEACQIPNIPSPVYATSLDTEQAVKK